MKDKRMLGGLIILAIGLIVICVIGLIFFRPPAGTPPPSTVAPALTLAPDDNRTLFTLANSTAEFELSEVFRGQPTAVIGISNGVSGQIGVDLASPATAVVSPIHIDARQFATGNNMRDSVLHRWILLSDSYPLVTFTPTSIIGLPDTITIGEPVEFTMAGDLLITVYSQPVEFAVVATAVADNQITGTATAIINRTDFELSVPPATGVADVSNEVELRLSFTALSN